MLQEQPSGPPDPRNEFEPAEPLSSGHTRLRLLSTRDGGENAWRSAPDDSDVFYYLRVLSRRRWLCATVFLVVVTAALVRSYTAVPIYEARARLLVELERLNLVDIEDVVERDTSAEVRNAILQSRALARRTLQALGELPPAGSPEVARETANGGGQHPSPGDERPAPGAVAQIMAAFRALPQAVLSFWRTSPPAPEPLPASASDASRAEARRIDAFLAGLVIEAAPGGVLDIGYRSSDPVRAARYANAVAEQYIEHDLERRFATIQQVTDWLAARLTEHRRKVDASEEALLRFREANDIVAIGGTDPRIEHLNELTAAMTQAKAKRIEKEVLHASLIEARQDTDSLPAALSTAAVQQLRLELDRLRRDRALAAEKLGGRHPEMVRLQTAIETTQARIQQDVDRIVESVAEQVEAARIAEARLVDAFEAEKRQAMAFNRKSVELAILQREAESNRQIYEMLLQRARETSIAREITPSTLRTLDAARVPDSPISPNRRRNIWLGFLVGLGLAVAAALSFERFDNRLKLPDEITRHLALPLIGLLPAVPRKRGEALLLDDGVPADFAEALRMLRTNVVFSFTEGSPRSVLVTSTSPKEGKTIISANLALGLAQAGYRVLLIDADMRRSMLHRVLGQSREPGLSNLLVGTANASEAVRPLSNSHLWFLAAGHLPPNPSELLGSRRCRELLARLGEHFEWIVIDSPPVMPVTDASVAAHKAHGVLFVVGAEMVDRRAARRALEQLESVDARLVGAVLNRVDLRRHAYYYSPYYNKAYGQYYGAAEEQSDSGSARL